MSVNTPGAFAALYKLVLKHQLTRGRAFLFLAVAAVAIGISFLARRGIDSIDEKIEASAFFTDGFGLGLVAPVISLVLGSATLGNWRDDETMVYVWLRPVSRWVIGLAATLGALTVALPVTVLPMTIGAWIGTNGDSSMVLATAISMALATVAYTALFVLLGLIIRRALVFGLVYVFVWEFFIARGAEGAARLSVNSYAKAVLSKAADVDIGFTNHSTAASYLVPLAIAAAAVFLTAWRLKEANVA